MWYPSTLYGLGKDLTNHNFFFHNRTLFKTFKVKSKTIALIPQGLISTFYSFKNTLHANDH